MNFAVVVPNKHVELARNLILSIRRHHVLTPLIVVVADGHNEQFGRNVVTVQSEFPDFVFARNVNVGIRHAGHKDVILINDDCEITEKDSLTKLVSIAVRHPRLGILSPVIDGGVGNPYQVKANWKPEWPDVIGIGGKHIDSLPICFPCVYLSRVMINKIGFLDENFTGYGFDDNDYCIRARRAGWETGITGLVCVQHGTGGPNLCRGDNWSVSFAQEKDRPSNIGYFRSKYPPSVEIIQP
jgi:hypothetical protein